MRGCSHPSGRAWGGASLAGLLLPRSNSHRRTELGSVPGFKHKVTGAPRSDQYERVLDCLIQNDQLPARYKMEEQEEQESL